MEEMMQASNATPQTKPEPTGFRTTTLAALGAKLPLGTVDPTTGQLTKEIAHGAWTLKTEKALAKLREGMKRATMGAFGAAVVGTLYTQLGGVRPMQDPHGWNRTMLDINQMWLGDVLYAYVWLRCQAIDYEFKFDTTCPRCAWPAKDVVADLAQLDVRIADSLKEVQWVYTLRNPVTIRGKTIETLLLGPCRWSAIESAAGGGVGVDQGVVKSAMIYSSIHAVPALEGLAVAEEELEVLSKRDLEYISAEIDTRNVGPVMRVIIPCKRCKEDYERPINWTFDNFFSVSSR